MKNFFIIFLIVGLSAGCGPAPQGEQGPHPELGELITFVGGEPEKTYVVPGYRNLPENKTDKKWENHDYIVFSYTNNQGDIKVAVTHRNTLREK